MISFFKKRSSLDEAYDHQHKIELLRPLVFIKLFANGLTITFFPQYILKLTLASHMPTSFASVTYVVYQVVFILMLIPGGYFGEVKSIKKLLLITTFIEALVLLGFAFATNVWEFLMLQAIFGCITPISSSADYAYILNYTNQKSRAQGFALYSNSLKGSMIAGIIVGGMLAAIFSPRELFLIATVFVLIGFCYALFLIPRVTLLEDQMLQLRRGAVNFKFVLKGLPKIFTNLSFVNTIFCVGFPLGVLDQGIVLFGLPLLLSYYHFSHAIIGQLLVIVTLGFFISNRFVSKKADQLNIKKGVMVVGLAGVAGALFFLSSLNLLNATHGEMLLFIFGLTVLGLFRGFLVAPASAYISEHAVTEVVGKNVTLSVYRLFQTLGSIVGPMIIMQLFVSSHYHLMSFTVLAATFLVLAVILFFGMVKMPNL